MNNMQKTPLQEAVERAHALGRRAVIPFITAGFPDKDSFWTHLSRIDESGADIIEIGVPFSDPVADGPVIEQASRDALARGVSLKWILDGLKARKGGFSAELVLMGYVNPFYQYGLEQLARMRRRRASAVSLYRICRWRNPECSGRLSAPMA